MSYSSSDSTSRNQGSGSGSQRGLPLLSGPPPPLDNESDGCRKCGKEFNVIFARSRRCNHCGYMYCHNCSDYQALMPRTGAERGYDVMNVCGYCIDYLTITAAGRSQLKSQGIAKLRKYASAYRIDIERAVEKDDIIDALMAIRGPNGCLPYAHEVFYRKHSVPTADPRPGLRNMFRSAPPNPQPQTSSSYPPRDRPPRHTTFARPDLSGSPSSNSGDPPLSARARQPDHGPSPPPPPPPPRDTRPTSQTSHPSHSHSAPPPQSSSPPPPPPNPQGYPGQHPQQQQPYPQQGFYHTQQHPFQYPQRQSQYPPHPQAPPQQAQGYPGAYYHSQQPNSYPPAGPPPMPTPQPGYPGQWGSAYPNNYAQGHYGVPPQSPPYPGQAVPGAWPGAAPAGEAPPPPPPPRESRPNGANSSGPPPPPPPRSTQPQSGQSTSGSTSASPPNSRGNTVPSLDVLITMSSEDLRGLSIGVLKQVLFQNHVGAGQVLEKGELVKKVEVLCEAERGERERMRRAEEREEMERVQREQEREDERAREAEIEREREERNAREREAQESSSSGRSAGEEPEVIRIVRLDPVESEDEGDTPTGGSRVADAAGSERPPSPSPVQGGSSSTRKPKPPVPSPASFVERTGLCVVCQDEEANIAIVDCGHLAMCRGCSELIMGSSRECPLCRTRIVTEQRLLRIFKT